MDCEIKFRSDVTVDLIDSMGSDQSIVNAARVSTLGGKSESESLSIQDLNKQMGLINHLMKNRHGCYDDKTEVLTSEGWKPFPMVDGTERFLTINPRTSDVEYQRASRVIHKPANEMIHITGLGVDLLVTPDHKMLAQPRVKGGWGETSLVPASEFEKRAYRVNLGGGNFTGGQYDDEREAAIAGFFAADGSYGSSLEFHLRKERKIAWLEAHHQITRNGDHLRLKSPSESLRLLAKDTYNNSGDRQFPREILRNGTARAIKAMLLGYLEGDGSVRHDGSWQASTVSNQLADDIQEAAIKCGMAAKRVRTQTKRDSSFGKRPLHILHVYAPRNISPRIGWTTGNRERQVKRVGYSGNVHCVTVPNGTLYVRRKGMSVWCGNSPFEHCTLTFRVEAPIFVWREIMRHRIASYNEESGRYKELEPVFYVPNKDRHLVQVGKASEYKLLPGSDNQHWMVRRTIEHQSRKAFEGYKSMLEAGVAREVARMCLPLNIYSSGYITVNLRALMNFLSLRIDWGESAKFSSHPQKEIEMVAYQMYFLASRKFPLAIDAWIENGMVAP